MKGKNELNETLQKLRSIIAESTASTVPVSYLDGVEVTSLKLEPGDILVVKKEIISDNRLDEVYDKHEFFEIMRAFQEISPEGISVVGLLNKGIELQIIVGEETIDSA